MIHQYWPDIANDGTVIPFAELAMQACADVHRQQPEEWDVKVWNTSELREGLEHSLVNHHIYDRTAPSSDLRSHIVRYEVLLHYGGIFLSSSMCCLR